MTPARRDWIIRTSLQWAERAAALRAGRELAAYRRAAAVEDWIARLAAELAGAPEPATTSAEVADLQHRLIRLEPYQEPRFGVWINDWPGLEPIRHRLRVRLAALLGQPPPSPAATSPSSPPLIALAPVPEPTPFTSGPQLDLFGAAAAPSCLYA